MECYMMRRGGAQTLADALRRMYQKHRRRIDADVVRIFCVSSAEAERDPTNPDWLERGPLDQVTAWIDIEQLMR